MHTYDDFDAWGDAVSGASLRLACDGVETGVWTHGLVDLGGVILQVASEGGGNLCYGANTHTGPTFFVPLTRANEHVCNGEGLDDDSLLAIPRGADFRIQLRRRAHAWCSIAFANEVAELAAFGAGSRRIACPPGAVPRLTRLVHEIAATMLPRPPGTAAHPAAGSDLATAVVACLAVPAPARVVPGRPRLNRAGIIRRAMAVIDAAEAVPGATELASRIGVTDRTLLRAFRETFGVPPKQYLLLRELHAIRRVLRDGAPEDATVADVLTRHGIWEFGRFAGRYRRQFGEPPSETLRRART
jgi:AraC-like DNA-binding protein